MIGGLISPAPRSLAVAGAAEINDKPVDTPGRAALVQTTLASARLDARFPLVLCRSYAASLQYDTG